MADRSSFPYIEADEEERRILRNLEDHYSDDLVSENDLVASHGNLDAVHALLATIDDDSEETNTACEERSPINPPLLALIRAKISAIEEDREKNRPSYLEAKRKEARKEYAQARAKEGRSVRRYEHHPFIEGETADERERRLRRSAYRRRAGKNDSTVRKYMTLAGLSEDERKERKRQQDAASKKRQRATKATT